MYDKMFEIFEDGVVNIVDVVIGEVLLIENVEVGDIWCMCIVKDVLICDWVKLVVICVCIFGMLVLFWLDLYCLYENELIKKVKIYLKDYDIEGLDI